MYNNPFGMYSPQANLDRINAQINELEKAKAQYQQPVPITQNFQLATPTHDAIRYANSLEEVQRNIVIGDTPYFSKDMSVVWIKNTKGDIKTYELNEIIPKDEKDMQIETLQARIKELERNVINEPSYEYANEPIEDEKPSSIQEIRRNKKK
ncbi:MAG: hypothetical protein IKN65_00735 [Clostridia bacterium]|nr:hypothetical protein [Bacilli bacterium]MBR3672809.1 hypothetical protein [Clostridia bacterium]